jgi:hypothetical protein
MTEHPFINVNNRVCRVTRREDQGPDLVKVSAVTSVRTARATSGKRPGPAWRPSPTGEKRKWVRWIEEVTDGIVIKKDDLLDEWPVGFIAFGLDERDLDLALTPMMQRAINPVGMATARRSRPSIRREGTFSAMQRQGLPFPTEEEFDAALTRVWDGLKPKKRRERRGRTAAGRTIIPDKRPTPPPAPKAGELPEGLQLPDKHRWSTELNMVVPDGKDGDLMEAASKLGWPIDSMEGAGWRKKGAAGCTLTFMAKTDYDAERFPPPRAPEPEPKQPERPVAQRGALNEPLKDPGATEGIVGEDFS